MLKRGWVTPKYHLACPKVYDYLTVFERIGGSVGGSHKILSVKGI